MTEFAWQKWSFPLRTSSVNVTQSTENCGFGHIYRGNPSLNTLCFAQRVKIKA